MEKFDKNYLESVFPKGYLEESKVPLSIRDNKYLVRKPASWTDSNSEKEKMFRDMVEANASIKEYLQKLPILDFTDLYGKNLKAKPFDSFSKSEVPNYFILKKDNAKYLVGTEGYDHIRYWIKLIGA